MNEVDGDVSVSLVTVQAAIDAIDAMDLEAQWRLSKFVRRLRAMKRALEEHIPHGGSA